MIFFVLLVNYTFKCNAYYVVSTMPFVHFRATHFCHCETPLIGDPAGYCVPVGKRSMQAKDNRLLLATIGWSKEKHTTHLPEGLPYYQAHARYCIVGPDGILCTRWEKEYASVRQTFVACDDCLVKNEAYDAEEKAQTSKRVSIIARDNAFSKSRLLYFWGKGINKQKTNDCRKRQSFGQKRSL